MNAREERRVMASEVWGAAAKLRDEAREHRREAKRLDEKAQELDGLAAAIADGRPLSEAFA